MLSAARVEEVYRRFEAVDPSPNRIPKKIKRDAFRSLISVVLSAQTLDSQTEKATRKLFAVAATPDAILELPPTRLRELIRDVGMYNMKTESVRKLCRRLIDDCDREVPRTRAGLMALPGVGRKSADIMLRFVFQEPAIAVDTHVFRVANRIGLTAEKTEVKTAEALAARTPERYRWGAHIWLLEHGKAVCRSRKPRCDDCLLNDICERNIA